MLWKKADLNSSQFKILEGANIDPPIEKLYFAGDIPDLETSIGVVGSRKVSEYGKRVCRDIVDTLARAGLTIVSGLMYGIDLEAHNTAINAGGKTIGILGYGHNHLKSYHYAQNLYEKIIAKEAGAVISEYEPEEPAAKWTFPKRNRVIAALSKSVLVIEGGENSGSLITAGYAIEQAKEVFAVPGSIYSENSGGTNWLIKHGAHMVTSAEDILSFYNIEIDKLSKNGGKFDALDTKILSAIESLGEVATHPKLAEATKLSMSDLNIRLSQLEINGIISRNIAGKFFVLR